MTIHINWCAALGAAAMLALSGAAASAAPATVRSTVNLRAGPDTTTEILDKIPAGSQVDAENCDNGWCAVIWQGKNGFAVKTAIDTGGRAPAPRRVVRSRAAPMVDDDDDDIIEVGPPVYYGYRPYYRPFGYYGYGGYYGYRGYGYRGGWGRRW
jgi:hypothetical protein